MIRKHKSSMATFFWVYFAIFLLIAGALSVRYYSNKRAQEKVRLEMEAALAEKAKAEADKVTAQKKMQKEAQEKAAAVAVAKLKKDAEEKAKKAEMAAKEKAAKEKNSVEEKKKPEVKTASALDLELEKMYPAPAIKPLIEIVGNWKAVPQKAFPAFVNIKVPVEFDVKRGTAVIGKGKLPVGSSLIPVRLQGDSLVLTNSRSSGTMVTLPVSDTNFKERITAKYNEFVKKQSADAVGKRKAEKERRLGKIAAETAVMKYNDGSDPRFDSMKASIRRGEAGVYQIESAGKWRWSGEEKIEGEKYQTAFVMMVSESAFGVTEKELKALIQGDKVVAWIDVASGDKM